jgi:serine/threonine protein kinase
MNEYKYMFKKLYTQTLFSRIYKYKNKLIKKVPKIIPKHIRDNNINNYNYKNEHNILEKINSPYIIKINETYEDTDYFYTVMDYYSRGDLHYNIQEKRISIKKYKNIIEKLITPISTIHTANIVHLDLKLENYLLNNNDNYLLIDFNLSQTHNNKYYELNSISDVVGTKPFIAPEIYEGYYCKSTDMYNLGCMLYLIYTCNNYNSNIISLEDCVRLHKLPPDLKCIIKDLLNPDYKSRPSVYDIKYYYLN